MPSRNVRNTNACSSNAIVVRRLTACPRPVRRTDGSAARHAANATSQVLRAAAPPGSRPRPGAGAHPRPRAGGPAGAMTP